MWLDKNSRSSRDLTLTRRHLFQKLGGGIGGIALASLFRESGLGLSASPIVPHSMGQIEGETAQSHFLPRAKNVIYIHMVGAPSHLDLFDYKPELQKRNGQLCPDEFFKGKQLAFIRRQPSLLGTPSKKEFEFSRCGQSGIRISNLLPNLQQVADEITFNRGTYTDQFNHAPAQMMMLSGFQRFGRPSIGAWASYGLGSENKNLPSFVVLVTGQVLGAGNSAWGSGFLPTVHQGVEFRSKGDPVLFLSNPKGIAEESRKRTVDAINQLNQRQLLNLQDPEIATRIDQYELAYRMQSSVPELMEIESESKETHAMYGTSPGKGSFANNCLLARRLVERGGAVCAIV